jgi:protein-S-isoprenylcysteine O-methyltransferase Ste14
MHKNMTVIGSGRLIALAVLPLLMLAIWLGMHFSGALRFGQLAVPVLLGAGIGLIVVGLSLNFASALLMLRAFNRKQLSTTGPYAVSRNPMYASFIYCTIPGLALCLNNWAILFVSVTLYLAVVIFVKSEETWLAATFGDEYQTYVRRVGRIFPKLW